MDNDPLDSLDLSKEELEVLESINIKFQKKLEQTQEDVKANPDKYFGGQDVLSDHPLEPRHITNYDRELYISLKIEMTALDENCNFQEITQVTDNAYHIPIPSGVDYQVKVNEFVNKFDQELGDCAKKISISEDDDKKE
tara:strand:+ start:5459 stop:5875 length:417 start_codon:yes stop_codon:yes gene_type:complete